MRLPLLFLCFSCISNVLNAQDSVLSKFYLSTADKTVILDWIMETGAICNGISIDRSSDSINFTEIGRIPGICGDPDYQFPFRFVDSFPVLNKTNYYRLFLAQFGYSDVRSVYVKYVESGKVLVKYNTASAYISLEFNNLKSDNYTLMIYDQSGRLVFSQPNIVNDKVLINYSHFLNGIYFFHLTNRFATNYSGKIFLQK